MKEAKYRQSKSVFSMTCSVKINIPVKAEVVWALLTDAQGFPRWNSTVTGIEGQIREGERLKLHVPGTKQTFKPKISGMVPNERMTWSDGVPMIFKGSRTFTLGSRADGSTDFTMEEHFGGIIFAIIKGMLPDFQPIFQSYAEDLRSESERMASAP